MVLGGGRLRDARDEAGALQPRRRYIHSASDDEDSDDQNSASDSSSGDDSEDGVSEPGEEERAVLDSALARIRRSQAKGKVQVKLSRVELAALGRHREREARALERRQRRRERTDRVAVPIEHLESMSRSLAKLPTPGNSGDDDGSPHRVPGSFHHEDREVYPPMGHFPPPNASSRALPSSSSQPVLGSDGRGEPDYNRSDSPFTYSYLRGPSTARHVSDPATTANNVDPFQYMTAGPRAPQYTTAGAAAAGDRGNYSRGSATAPAAARGRPSRGPPRHDTESSEEEDDDDSTASDDDDDEEETNNTRRPPVHNTRSRAKQTVDSSSSRRRSEIVVEVDPESESESEPEPERVPERSRSSKSKKPSRSSSSANPKRKSTGASSSSAPNIHASRQRKKK